MSTAAFPGALGPVLVREIPREVPGFAGGWTDNVPQGRVDLTIHRISKTHHGRTLVTLGHAAEHLANSQRFDIHGREDASVVEAVHILMGLSRSVFDDLAGRHSRRRRIEQWLIERVAGVFESACKSRGHIRFEDRAESEGCITC
ncbi:MAG: hypothetical protein M3Y50_00655 [Acidobacteriota bacterium]|nr:hypothetical protein [Acidobacteriota bacterium]